MCDDSGTDVRTAGTSVGAEGDSDTAAAERCSDDACHERLVLKKGDAGGQLLDNGKEESQGKYSEKWFLIQNFNPNSLRASNNKKKLMLKYVYCTGNPVAYSIYQMQYRHSARQCRWGVETVHPDASSSHTYGDHHIIFWLPEG